LWKRIKKINPMKNRLLTILVFTFLSITGYSQIHLGGGLQYLFDAQKFGVQAKSKIGLTEKVDLAAAGTLYFGEGTRFGIDADVQYHLFSLGSIDVYPLVGFNILTGDTGGIQLNAGLYSDFLVNERMYYIEPKFIIEKNVIFALSVGTYLF